MAANRKLKAYRVGRYGNCTVQHFGAIAIEEGSPIYGSDYITGVDVEVTEKWVYVHLPDGEVKRMDRKRNGSAQLYPDMDLQAVLREKLSNKVEQQVSGFIEHNWSWENAAPKIAEACGAPLDSSFMEKLKGSYEKRLLASQKLTREMAASGYRW